MPLSMYDATVPVFARALTQLRAVLAKGAAHAQAKKIEESVLLAARLYPDMFPLADQVRVASDIARGVATRLSGGEPPKYEDNETTFADLIARLDRAIADIKGLEPQKFEGAEARTLTRPVGGQSHTFTGRNYLFQFGVPNVLFHVTTAYDILRHNGVELGKRDYIGALD